MPGAEACTKQQDAEMETMVEDVDFEEQPVGAVAADIRETGVNAVSFVQMEEEKVRFAQLEEELKDLDTGTGWAQEVEEQLDKLFMDLRAG